MTDTPVQMAERTPSHLVQGELSRTANLSPKLETPGARQIAVWALGLEVSSTLMALADEVIE